MALFNKVNLVEAPSTLIPKKCTNWHNTNSQHIGFHKETVRNVEHRFFFV